MSLGRLYWSDRWEKSRTGWQLNEIHPKLEKYLMTLTRGAPSQKFFIPLCGKTKDIPYLLSLGHTVFGIEYVAKAIEELNEENSLGLEFDRSTSTYQTSDGRLTIFHGDFQLCPIEKWGPFDVIWDRSALIAIHYSLRLPYAALMKRAVTSKTKPGHKYRYLLQSVEYDKNMFEGPPKCVTDEDVTILFNWAKIIFLERNEMPKDDPYRTVNGTLAGEAFEAYHLLQNKSY